MSYPSHHMIWEDDVKKYWSENQRILFFFFTFSIFPIFVINSYLSILNLEKKYFVLTRNIVLYSSLNHKIYYSGIFYFFLFSMIYFYPAPWSCDGSERVNKLYSCEQVGDQPYTKQKRHWGIIIENAVNVDLDSSFIIRGVSRCKRITL